MRGAFFHILQRRRSGALHARVPSIFLLSGGRENRGQGCRGGLRLRDVASVTRDRGNRQSEYIAAHRQFPRGWRLSASAGLSGITDTAHLRIRFHLAAALADRSDYGVSAGPNCRLPELDCGREISPWVPHSMQGRDAREHAIPLGGPGEDSNESARRSIACGVERRSSGCRRTLHQQGHFVDFILLLTGNFHCQRHRLLQRQFCAQYYQHPHQCLFSGHFRLGRRASAWV